MTVKKSRDVYVENSVFSYLAARPSRDLLTAACQQMTAEWWDKRRNHYSLYVSELVVTEASQGDSTVAKKRLEFLKGIPLVPMSDEVEQLAESFLHRGALPRKALADALHIAVAAYHEIDYLMTWNCTRIANAEIIPLVRNICVLKGYRCPEICTPQELLGETT